MCLCIKCECLMHAYQVPVNSKKTILCVNGIFNNLTRYYINLEIKFGRSNVISNCNQLLLCRYNTKNVQSTLYIYVQLRRAILYDYNIQLPILLFCRLSSFDLHIYIYIYYSFFGGFYRYTEGHLTFIDFYVFVFGQANAATICSIRAEPCRGTQ